jgi:hypothetical protein
LVVFGYLNIFIFIVSVLFLAAMFPLSVLLGTYTSKKFNYDSEFFDMISAWEHGEVWYGLAQDIAFITIFLSLI